jgi:hypothetical protein
VRDLQIIIYYICPINREFPSGIDRDVGMYLDNGSTRQILTLESIEQYVEVNTRETQLRDRISGRTLSVALVTFPHPLNGVPVSVEGSVSMSSSLCMSFLSSFFSFCVALCHVVALEVLRSIVVGGIVVPLSRFVAWEV